LELYFLLFAAAPFQNAYTTDELYFATNSNESDLNTYNLTQGKIISVDGIVGGEEIYSNFLNLTPNQTINFEVEVDGLISTYPIKTFESEQDSERGLIGISLSAESTPIEGSEVLGTLSQIIFKTFFWLFVLNISIGAINLLPLWITDGGKIAHLLFQYKFSEGTSMILYNIVSILSLIMLFISLFPQIIFSLFK
jgi:membrane-associated protease RseP (regulator of RpoE activity)